MQLLKKQMVMLTRKNRSINTFKITM